ncbi:hypothetical protein [Alicyclobacillus sp.]|uniref:hypothetical protein n=1 Tax=Alicyclobacillus sp. TaxID=61169 RepID=UPI0025B91FB6|nr:hypothetical protein [Alicyclobacillus sp.]MCL6516971.1 hypothetical protein [Alicyclobacillus sp.]
MDERISRPNPRLQQRNAQVTSLVDVDSPDDLPFEGRPEGAQHPEQSSAQGAKPWVKVDNPDDFE